MVLSVWRREDPCHHGTRHGRHRHYYYPFSTSCPVGHQTIPPSLRRRFRFVSPRERVGRRSRAIVRGRYAVTDTGSYTRNLCRELERSEARRAAEEGILKLTAEWRERMARARQAQDAATAAGRAEPAVDAEEPPKGTQADADPAAVAALTAERDRLQAELHTLREENGRLRGSNAELRAESGRRDEETRTLNELVVRSRRTEEQWRQAYVESRKGRRPDDTPVRIDSVGEAVTLARGAFGDRLLIKLNSRSNENTPFARPCASTRRR